MNRRLIQTPKKHAWPRPNCGLALAALVFFPVACMAQEPPPATAATPAVFSSPELDALAAKLAAQIAKQKVKSVVVVGVPGPERRVTNFGVSVRNALEESLARQAHGVKVIDTAAIRAFLGQSRIAEDMVYSNALREWITEHMNADAFVIADLGIPANGRASISGYISIQRKGAYVQESRIDAVLTLTAAQIRSADVDFLPELKIPALKEGAEGVTVPTCISCPNAEVSEEARKLKIMGAVSLLATVKPDGVTDDIFVTRPAGYGLDAKAVDAVLNWKFKPAVDAKGQAVAMQIPLDIKFDSH
jgi:TonB family protein